MIERETDLKHIKEETTLPGEWREVKVECPHCKVDEFIYIYDDDKTCYCCQCDNEFDIGDVIETGEIDLKTEDSREDREIQSRLEEMVSDDPEVVKQLADRLISTKETEKVKDTLPLKQLSLPGHQPKTTYWEGGKSYSSFINNCTHTPQHIIDGEGWGVWAGKKDDCKYRAKDFDVVLNLTFTSIKEPHIIPIPELEEFEEVDCSYKEIQLDWPDYGTVNMPREFWVKLLKYLSDNKLRMLVFCLGGHGRTGTALAVMMGLAFDYTPERAINWLRRYYCSSAVETAGQENYVSAMLKPDLNLSLKESIKSGEVEKGKEILEEIIEKKLSKVD